MQATVNWNEIPKLADVYLGFAIQLLGTAYIAVTMGWHGDILSADTLPKLRQAIWRYWHLMQ